MDRRSFLHTSSAFAALSLAGCKTPRATTPAPATAPTLPWYDAIGPLPPIHADLNNLFRITVCTRPFRASGPRIEAEKIADKMVIHNYGHGGSGWSLSWGSAEVALEQAIPALEGARDIAIIGCGAIGLTTAIAAQRAGLRVTIYAKERPPFVRSSRATGSWTPASRIALEGQYPASFPALWERMARRSFATYQNYLASPGDPVEFLPFFSLSADRAANDPPPPPAAEHHEFADLRRDAAGIAPGWNEVPPVDSPFRTSNTYVNQSLTFNVAAYSRLLINDFLIAGGVLETRDFHTPAEFSTLPQKAVICCLGYASRQFWKDESIVPIRGQIGWLVPQPDAHYGFQYRDLIVLARRDGIVIQTNPQGDDTGWNDDSETPDPIMTEAGIRTLQHLYDRMKHA